MFQLFFLERSQNTLSHDLGSDAMKSVLFKCVQMCREKTKHSFKNANIFPVIKYFMTMCKKNSENLKVAAQNPKQDAKLLSKSHNRDIYLTYTDFYFCWHLSFSKIPSGPMESKEMGPEGTGQCCCQSNLYFI